MVAIYTPRGMIDFYLHFSRHIDIANEHDFDRRSGHFAIVKLRTNQIGRKDLAMWVAIGNVRRLPVLVRKTDES